MASPELLIRSILGDVRSSIRPLACAGEIIGELFFLRHIPLEDIRAQRVYLSVARRAGLSPAAASRRLQRLSRLCWDRMCEQDLVLPYIGQSLPRCPDACRLTGYLVVYAHLRVPYFTAIEQDPSLLFAPFLRSPPYLPPRPGPPPGREGRRTLCPACGLPAARQNFCGHCGQRLP